MIRIKNQEEFKKCCEMCNSKDLESRYLGISLMNECVEHLNFPNLSRKLLVVDNGCLYNWNEYIETGINAIWYKFGDELYELLSQGHYHPLTGLEVTLIEND